ncbi:MAG TPA: hypothetical protein DEB40_13810 [Elusimicrobia bacterium]|nr:hypothetical protein [Elusimicrobiota bacterium]HBT62809.1 hypothetical protein [Elusimicrobiota bacterium]
MSPHPFRRQENLAEISDVNVVPLADVSLVLLIILLLLSPMMTQSMLHVRTAAKNAETPEAADPEPQLIAEKPPEFVLVVDLGPGGMAVGDTLFTSLRDLAAYLRLVLPGRGDRKVFLAPHPDVTHGQVVATIETIKSAGASGVALVQTIEEGSP